MDSGRSRGEEAVVVGVVVASAAAAAVVVASLTLYRKCLSFLLARRIYLPSPEMPHVLTRGP
jgi:hypothetical protein